MESVVKLLETPFVMPLKRVPLGIINVFNERDVVMVNGSNVTREDFFERGK
jgi:hypothetical protein